ncbi:MAG TPA: clostripain-related cysteine peptidase [Atribacterota bacterium]|nr:clostripain-related cysteine peptidase [Atribacterota bacterium]
MKYKHVIIFVLIMLSISLTGCFLFPPRDNTAEWTVMIYLDSDNNLESAGIDDINEMEIAGSTSEVNIVVQADRIPYSILAANNQGYADDISNGNWTNTRRYYITQDFDPVQINSQLKSDLGELNMGDPQTLIDFTNWATVYYPAKKYLLVIWNHGGGFRSPAYTTKDIAWDDTSGGDKITMPELEYSLSAISAQIGEKIDVVGMDACFMAMTEVAYQIKDYADILVTSEESEPFNGWPYDTILGELAGNPLISSEQFAADIVDKYIFSYPYNNVTQSAIDLSYMDTLTSQLSNLALAIMSDSSTTKSKYVLASTSSQYYGDWDFIDLFDFCNQLLTYSNGLEVKNIASNIQQTLNYAVIKSEYSGGSVSGSKGLSIYFPYTAYHYYYNYTNFAQDTFWDEMLSYLGY